MSCDLVTGRLLDDCLAGKAGIKTLFFTKLSDFAALTGVVEAAGEITDLGADPVDVYRFEMSDNVGNFTETVTASKDNGTSFISQLITLSLFNIKPADLADLNNLKKGNWVIFTLDYNDKMRVFGRYNGCTANGGEETSGTAAADKRGLDLTLMAEENDYAIFLQDYTTTPLDNFANVTVTPAY
jgi:hypothetical protein